MKFKCIKGMATLESVVVMQDDNVKLISIDEGEVVVEGVDGWCKGFELTFTPKEFVEHFRSLHNIYEVNR